ncbi:MAG: bile acid:sodium symporter family protein, partial [Chitinophagaceae bacterium]
MAVTSSAVYRLFYALSIGFFIGFLVVTLMERHDWGGWLLMLSLASLAIAFRGNKLLRGSSYTITILAVVSLA